MSNLEYEQPSSSFAFLTAGLSLVSTLCIPDTVGRLLEVIDGLEKMLKSAVCGIDKMASSDETQKSQDAERYNEVS